MFLKIDKSWINQWSNEYGRRFLCGNSTKWEMKQELRLWLASLPDTKYLDREHFLLLGGWKLPRQMPNYLRNSGEVVRSATRKAFMEPELGKKLEHLIKPLHGVGPAVAATILHFLHPNEIAIFDYHARAVLAKAGQWNRGSDDDSLDAWLEYNEVMVRLANQMDVSIRELDKAMWAYDKWA